MCLSDWRVVDFILEYYFTTRYNELYLWLVKWYKEKRTESVALAS